MVINGICCYFFSLELTLNTVTLRVLDVFGICRKLLLYPTGDNRENGKNISVYLESVDAKGFNRQKRVKAKFSISLKNQNGGEHHKRSGTYSCSFNFLP